MFVARGDAIALTRELVRIDSRNPSLVAGAPGEGDVARALGDVLRAWGFDVELMDAAPGRPNVVARVGHAGRRSLMFNGHLDIVGVDGMIHPPFDVHERAERIYGRGSADMKAGVATMCAAAARAMDAGLDGEIVIAAVVDEEFESLGTRALIERGVRADAAIVTEPTGLAIMPAHLGFVWLDVTTYGRAAHGSRWDLGVDAIRHAGLVLAELDRIDSTVLTTRRHQLLGRPSVHASLIAGGTGMSTYPDRCTIRIERRTIPGETPQAVEQEVARRVRARGGGGTRLPVGCRRYFIAGAERRIGRRAHRTRVASRDQRCGAERAHRGDDGVDGCRAPQLSGNSRDLFRTGRHGCRARGGGVRVD